jgi:tetratricopeptide (TPR) repeat protein
MTVEKDGYQPINDAVKLRRHRPELRLRWRKPRREGRRSSVLAWRPSRGNFDQAVTQFQAAIAQAPAVPALHVNLALAYFRLNRQAEAVASLEQAAALGPGDAAIQYQLGSAYVDMQAYDKAVAALQRGLATKPDLAKDLLAAEATAALGAVYFAQARCRRRRPSSSACSRRP